MRSARIIFTVLTMIALTGTAFAAEALRVCAGENDLPYSDKNGDGFENKLAELIGRELGRPVEYVWWTDPRYFVRDLLERGACDVVMGVDEGDPRMLTSQPYYRTGYVFVHRKEKGLKVSDWDDVFLKTAQRIAFMPDTPAEIMIKKIGRYSDMFNYQQSLVGFKSRRNQYVRYDPEKLVHEVETGGADLAVLFAPQAARYIKKAQGKLVMHVIPDEQVRSDGEKVPHHYTSAIGVRKEAPDLLTEINRVLAKRKKEVRALLESEGIPLLPLNTGVAVSGGKPAPG